MNNEFISLFTIKYKLKGVNMELNKNNILYSNNIGEIIGKGLKNPIVIKSCTHSQNKNNAEIKKVQIEFSRFIGFCILFRNVENIDKYMLLNNKNDQIDFLKKKIAKQIGISEHEITKRKKDIVEFAFNNFKKNGYVFHAANSQSVMKKMIYGLKDNDVDIEQQHELLQIEALYRKYNPNSKYSPLGHGATDIKDNKTGWFFDGLPIHSTGYANSPQWFNYLCGKSYVYFDDIPEEQRNGYASRDYKKALNAVLWLVKNENMIKEDKKKLLLFFKKNWDKYRNTTPCLIFIPVKEVEINEELSIEQYLSDEGINELFNDIIGGIVNPIKNCCCKKIILPDKLSFVDLSPILPRSENDTNDILKNNNEVSFNFDIEER